MDITHLRQLSEILGHKWDLVILGQLTKEPLRYMEIASQVREIDSDLTEGVLSKNLRRLTNNGLLCRQSTKNGYHVYDLTIRGRYIMAALGKISDIDGQEPLDEPEHDGSGE